MAVVEIFIVKLGTKDGLTPSSVEVRDVSGLRHKIANDPMKYRARIAHLPPISFADRLSGAQLTKILRRLRTSFCVQFKRDAPQILAGNAGKATKW